MTGSPHAAGAVLPTTPAGERASAWLSALDTGHFETLRDVIAGSFDATALEKCSAHNRATRQINVLYPLTHGLVAVSVVDSTEHAISLIAKARLTEDLLRVRVQVAGEPPFGVIDHVVAVAGPPPLVGPGGLDDQEILGALGEYVDRLAAADLFSGAVLVARDGQPRLRVAHGLASHAFRRSNGIDTKFNLASMNKMFTAVAVAQLAQQGALAFDDLVGAHLTDYPNEAVATSVRIHHLLTHTSGLGAFWNEKFEAAKTRLRTVAEFVELFADDPLAFKPGERFEYSNSGFVVLGAIVERVSGQSYYDYVAEHVYGPAGMIDTESYEMDLDVANLAIGYTRDDHTGGLALPTRRNNLFRHSVKGSPAGGGYSTVEDLLRFDASLRSHRLLDEAHTDLVLSKKVEMPDGKGYGYGFFTEWLGSGRSGRVVGHSGRYPGTSGQLDMYLDSGWTLAVLANYDPPAAHRITRKMRSLMLPAAAPGGAAT